MRTCFVLPALKTGQAVLVALPATTSSTPNTTSSSTTSSKGLLLGHSMGFSISVMVRSSAVSQYRVSMSAVSITVTVMAWSSGHQCSISIQS